MPPLVSVIMPARNVDRFIGPAIDSVQGQTCRALELIIIDDRSEDGTPQIIKRRAAEDSRLRLISGEGRGPGAARNIGLSSARGRWVAVVDADDELLPDRLDGLLAIAEAGAHLVADNLTAFYDDGRADHIWLSGCRWESEHTISLEAFLQSGIDGTATDQPGYLKPLFDRLWLQQHGLRYDETLTIGEDFDLVARALAKGAVYRFIPGSGYRYRRHGSSTSHRISAAQLDSMVAAFERMRPHTGARERLALDRRIESLVYDQWFIGVVDDLKAGSLPALWRAMGHAGLRRRLISAARDGLARRLSGR